MKTNSGFNFQVYKAEDYQERPPDEKWEANLMCGRMNMECQSFKTRKQAVKWCKHYFDNVPIDYRKQY